MEREQRSLSTSVLVLLAIVPAIVSAFLGSIGSYYAATNQINLQINTLTIKMDAAILETSKLRDKESDQDRTYGKLHDDFIKFQAIAEYRLETCQGKR